MKTFKIMFIFRKNSIVGITKTIPDYLIHVKIFKSFWCVCATACVRVVLGVCEA